MAVFQRSAEGIGRGEVAESQGEAPFFVAFTLMSFVALGIFQYVYQNENYTIALSVSLVVFAITIVRVEFGLYVLTVAMLLSPEIEAGSVGTHDERGLNLRYDDILIFIIFIGVMVRQAFEGRLKFWRPNPINVGIMSYLFVCMISNSWALYHDVPAWDKSVAFFVMLKMFEFYLVFWIISHVITNVKEMQRQLVVFFAVSLVVCGYGIMTIGTLDRISAPFDAGGTEPNTLGGYLLIIMCVCGGLFIYSPTLKWKLANASMIIVAFIPFIMTLSRASYTSLFVAFLALGYFARKPLIIGLAVLVVATAPFTMPEDVINRVNYTFQPEGVELDLELVGIDTDIKIDSSTYERVYVWEKVRYNLAVWPWFGGGVSWDTVLDSQYARILIETGIMGMTAFSFMLFLLLRTSWQAFRWNHYWVTKGLSLGMLITTIGLMVHSLGTISFLIVRIMEPFWMLMAFTVVAREIALVDFRQREEAYYRARETQAEAEDPHEISPEMELPAAS